MIQFNLLPAVKLDYVKARRTKRVTMLMSVIVGAASLAIMTLLFFGVQIVQKKHSSDLSKDIKQESAKLKEIQDLNKILTIQNQLNSLPELHDKKPVVTRLIGFMQQVTPASVSIAELSVNFEAKSITIKGSAAALGEANKFVDTLKFATFKSNDQDKRAFLEVVSELNRGEKSTSYSLALKFDEAIFSNASDVKLDIPAGKITTRSQTEKPENLFKPINTEIPGVQ